jgi:hypothetical protein
VVGQLAATPGRSCRCCGGAQGAGALGIRVILVEPASVGSAAAEKVAPGRGGETAIDTDDGRPDVVGPSSSTGATGSRPTVRAASLSSTAPRGVVVAPDGGTAAMFRIARHSTVTAYLLDLASGASRPIDRPIDRAVGDGSVVWPPDSRWLFAGGADEAIYSVAPVAADVTPLGCRCGG